MYIEKNTIALQQLFKGENIYLLKDEFENKTLPVPSQTPLKLTVETPTTASYYQPKQKVIVILTSLNPVDSELLGKILGAVKLDLQSVDIIEFVLNRDVDLSQIFIQKSVNQVIAFGVNLSDLKLDMSLTPYLILEKQGIKFIYSDSLSDIQNDIPKKKALWGGLKEMF
jgi:DNA polymerase III psi subunit